MHTLVLEFTYLWSLNGLHWLKVWCYICIWPQLWTGTSAWTCAHICTHTHECKHRSEQLGVFAVRAGLSFSSLSHTMTHALSVFALLPTQTACVSVPWPFKHTLRLAFVKAHTNWEGLASGHTEKTRAKFIEKSSRILEMYLIHFSQCFLHTSDNVLAFQSGSQRYWPHIFSITVTKTNVLWGRSWHGEFTKPVEAHRPHSVTEQFIKMWLTMNSRLPVQNE